MTAMSRALLKFLHAASLLLLLCAAAGCASSARQDPPHEPAQHRLSDFHEEDQDFPVDVYDPLEGFNRGVYKFNAVFDKYVFLPVVGAYETVTPEFARTGVSNFFTNIYVIEPEPLLRKNLNTPIHFDVRQLCHMHQINLC